MKQLMLKKSVLALIAIGAMSSAVYAQTTEKREDPAAREGESAQIDKVTVTANRRTETAQKVSGVVQSISADQMRKDGITELRALQTAVPGLSIANQEGNLEIFIRGVGSTNSTELGDPAAAPHLNGIYIPRPRGLGLMFYDLDRAEVNKGPQGTLYGRNAMAGTINIITARPRLGSFGGYAQAEVSARKGAGAEAALNIPAGEDLAFRVAASYTKKDHGFVNASTDPAASRLKPTGHEENSAGRVSMLWLPTDNLRIFAMADVGRESGTGYPAPNAYSTFVKSGGGFRAEDLDLRRVVYRGPQGEMTNDLSGLQTKIEYDLGSVTAELNASYRKVDFYQRNSGADGIAYQGRDLSTVDYDNFSSQYWETKSESKILELRFSSNNDKQPLRWSAGLFGFNEDQQVGFFSLNDRGIFYSGTEFVMPEVKSKSKAIFGDGVLDIAPNWRVLGGLRYTDESKSRYGIGGNWTMGLGDADFNCCFSVRLGTEGFRPAMLNRPNFNVRNITTVQDRARFLIQGVGTPGARDTLIRQANGECFNRPDIDGNGRLRCTTAGGFTYDGNPVQGIPAQQEGSSKANYGDLRLGIEHDLNKDQMVYAKISSGHKAGGFNDTFQLFPVPETYEPEKVVVLEAGSRNAFDFMGRRAVFNVTGFYYDYSNQVFQDLACTNIPSSGPDAGKCKGYSLVNRNIGKSKLAGLEIETRLQLSSSTKLDLNALLLSTKVKSGRIGDARSQDFGKDGIAALIDLAGNKLPQASDFTLTARLQQEFAVGPGKFDWQALANYRSAYYLTPYNEDDVVSVAGARTTAADAGFPDKQKGYATLNLGFGYTWKNFRGELFITNVTDEQASQKALVGSGLNIRFLNDKRSAGLRGRWTF